MTLAQASAPADAFAESDLPWRVDIDWITGAIRMFSFVMPCPIKVFANKDYAQAMRWTTLP